MQKKWWEPLFEWLCDYWLVGLLVLLLALSAYFVFPHFKDSADNLVDVTVSQRTIQFDLRDNGYAVDGDRIQLLINGSIAVEDLTLTGEGTTVNLTLKGGSNKVVLRALNEGYSSPNTVYFAISDVVSGPSVQISNGMLTDETAEFNIHAP